MTTMTLVVGILPINAANAKMYIPGGMPFGAKVYSDGVIVSMFTQTDELSLRDNPAVKGGMNIGDIIKKIDKTPIKTAENLSESIGRSEGKELQITVLRGEKETILKITPTKCSDGEYRLGINVRDSMAGIGTVTFISPESGAFGGLGHGICEITTGDVIPIIRGTINNVKINSIVKGEKGTPGEIRGAFTGEKIGTLLKNTECGIFGILGSPPTDIKPMPIAEISEVKTGEAYILCTLDTEGIKKYKIQIEKIDSSPALTTKNFQIKICDNSLLEKTSGIVQGMSGSPIIQNGKIVGAVTHVMVNEPQRGYGIYIGNMLNELPSLLT